MGGGGGKVEGGGNPGTSLGMYKDKILKASRKKIHIHNIYTVGAQ